VLDLSKLEDGSLELEIKAFNLHAVFKEVCTISFLILFPFQVLGYFSFALSQTLTLAKFLEKYVNFYKLK
jgi:hypothetical protein